MRYFKKKKVCVCVCCERTVLAMFLRPTHNQETYCFLFLVCITVCVWKCLCRCVLCVCVTVCVYVIISNNTNWWTFCWCLHCRWVLYICVFLWHAQKKISSKNKNNKMYTMIVMWNLFCCFLALLVNAPSLDSKRCGKFIFHEIYFCNFGHRDPVFICSKIQVSGRRIPKPRKYIHRLFKQKKWAKNLLVLICSLNFGSWAVWDEELWLLVNKFCLMWLGQNFWRKNKFATPKQIFHENSRRKIFFSRFTHKKIFHEILTQNFFSQFSIQKKMFSKIFGTKKKNFHENFL